MENPVLKGIVFALYMALSSAVSAAHVEFTVTHCSPLNGPTGKIEFLIDTTYTKGPFSVRLEGPDGFLDTMPAFRGAYHLYTGLRPGRYWISIRCCGACEAKAFLDIKCYENTLLNDVYVFLIREKTVPELDSTAILLACTDTEEESGQLCSVTISLFTPEDLTPGVLQVMLEQMLACVNLRRMDSYYEALLSSPDYDARIPDPCQILIRFNAKGEIRWMHFESDW